MGRRVGAQGGGCGGGGPGETAHLLLAVLPALAAARELRGVEVRRDVLVQDLPLPHPAPPAPGERLLPPRLWRLPRLKPRLAPGSAGVGAGGRGGGPGGGERGGGVCRQGDVGSFTRPPPGLQPAARLRGGGSGGGGVRGQPGAAREKDSREEKAGGANPQALPSAAFTGPRAGRGAPCGAKSGGRRPHGRRCLRSPP